MKGSAKALFLTGCRLFGFVLTMALLVGCQSLSFDPRGHTVPVNCWIVLPQAGEYSGTWKNEDLTIAYKFVRTQSRLAVSGTIQFAGRITKVNPVIQFFHLDAIAVDAQGKVLEMIGLTTATGVDTFLDDMLGLDTVLTLPSNADAIAFSYRGRTAGTKDGGLMDFWEYPVY